MADMRFPSQAPSSHLWTGLGIVSSDAEVPVMQVADRGLKFVGVLGELLTDAGLPQNFREAWAFSACLALAVQLAHTAPVSSAGMQPALMPTTSDARCSNASSWPCACKHVGILQHFSTKLRGTAQCTEIE